MTRLLLPLFLVGLLQSGCTDPNAVERRLLLSELQEAETRYASANQQVLELRSSSHQSETRLKSLRSELADYEGRVQAFMMNHKMATAALMAGTGGAAVALDPNNEFSDEARQIGGIIGVIAGVYCFENSEECARVGDQLVQASARVDDYKSQIRLAEETFSRDQKLLATAEQEFEVISTEVRSLRVKLRNLDN